MNWIKKGLLYAPEKNFWWNMAYGMIPTPVYLEELNIIRIFFGVTDADRNSRITYLDLNADDPSEVVYTAHHYVLDIGIPGMFDDCGVVPCCVLQKGGEEFLYFVGFQRCEKVPYMLFPGVAISPTGKNEFKRFSAAPIIDRTINNPVSSAAPYVLFDEGVYKMWYWRGKEWTKINEKPYIRAEITYAESNNGLNWEHSDILCIDPDPVTEFSVGRPWVLKENGLYKMWYSVRYIDRLYRLGYAESTDGKAWVRKDESVGIEVSESGWDSEMICYPAVIKVKERTLLFYNGNDNGKTGFGYAELQA